MDKFVDERDFKLIDQNRYTFFVLRRILGGPCKLILLKVDSYTKEHTLFH